MPGSATEANGEKTIRRNLHAAHGGDEACRIAFDIGIRRSGEAQPSASAARHGRKYAVPGVAMKRMALGAYRERVKRRRVAFPEIGIPDSCRRFIQLIAEVVMRALSCHDADEQLV